MFESRWHTYQQNGFSVDIDLIQGGIHTNKNGFSVDIDLIQDGIPTTTVTIIKHLSHWIKIN